MINKLKDIFYDLSDFILTLIIILVIILAIAFIMTRTFNIDIESDSIFDLLNDGDRPTAVTDETSEPESDEMPMTDETESPTESIVPINPIPESEEAETQESVPAETTEPNAQIEIEIPPGGTATQFSQDLEEAGIIEDSQTLLNQLTEDGLDTRLQTGNYVFTPNMTYQDIVNVLFP